jgi:hypothetical protein
VTLRAQLPLEQVGFGQNGRNIGRIFHARQAELDVLPGREMLIAPVEMPRAT